MSHGILDRPNDRPSQSEEAAIARIRAVERVRERQIGDIQWVLERSASRSRVAKARGCRGDRDLMIERIVQNRRLDERNALLGVPKPLEEVADAD